MTVKAYAKINLTLEVLGKRADGYHALRSLVQPISLADTLEIEEGVGLGITTDTGYGEDDLIVKAARLLGDRPLHIRVVKRIPTGGGLGGGSADAAAILLSLNKLWGLNRSPEELAEIGAKVGSDVPALVLAQHYRMPVLMEGRGEVVHLAPDAASPGRTVILVNPGVNALTPAVFKAFTHSTYPTPKNDLESPAIALYPEIGEALEALRSAGVEDVAMSGSGATVFGFAASTEDAERIATNLRAKDLHAWVASFIG